MSMAAVKYTPTAAGTQGRTLGNKNFTSGFEAIAVTELSASQKENFHYSEFDVEKAENHNHDNTVHHDGLLADLENMPADTPAASAHSAADDVDVNALLAQLQEMGIDLSDTDALASLAGTPDTSAMHGGFDFNAHSGTDINSAFDHVVSTTVDFSHHMANSVDAIAAFQHAEATVVADFDSHLSIGEVSY
jgi:hypothetical protein